MGKGLEDRNLARIELCLPQDLMRTLDSATVCTIYHSAGEPVRKGEPLLELINDEGLFDLPAPETGIIIEIAVRSGDKVRRGTRLVVLESGGKNAGKR